MQVTINHKQNGIFDICVNFGGGFSLKHVLHLKNPRAAKLQGCTSPTLFLKVDVSKLQSTMRPLLVADFFPVYLCQKSKATEKLQNVTARPKRGTTCHHIFQNKMLYNTDGRRHSSHLLSNAERDISILNHVHNLALHCEDKQHNPITKQYRPENRDIKHRKEGHQKRHTESFSDGIPETTKPREITHFLSLH